MGWIPLEVTNNLVKKNFSHLHLEMRAQEKVELLSAPTIYQVQDPRNSNYIYSKCDMRKLAKHMCTSEDRFQEYRKIMTIKTE